MTEHLTREAFLSKYGETLMHYDRWTDKWRGVLIDTYYYSLEVVCSDTDTSTQRVLKDLPVLRGMAGLTDDVYDTF